MFENEEGCPSELGGQDAEGLALGVLSMEALEVPLAGWIVLEKADGCLAEGPFEVDVADLGTGGAEKLAVGLLGAFDEAGIGGEVLDGGKASDVADLVEDREAEDLPYATDRLKAAQTVGIMATCLVEDGVLEFWDQGVVVVDKREVGTDAGSDGGVVEGLGKFPPVVGPRKAARRTRQVVLGEGVLDVSEELGALASEVEATAKKIAGGSHLLRINKSHG